MTEKPLDRYKWAPGQSGNPSGRAKLPGELVAFKKTSYRDFIAALHKYGSWSIADLDEEAEKASLGAFDLMFVNIVRKAALGDPVTRQLLIDRLWGKVREVDDALTLTKVSNQDLIEMAKNAITILQAPTLDAEAEQVPEGNS